MKWYFILSLIFLTSSSVLAISSNNPYSYNLIQVPSITNVSNSSVNNSNTSTYTEVWITTEGYLDNTGDIKTLNNVSVKQNLSATSVATTRLYGEQTISTGNIGGFWLHPTTNKPYIRATTTNAVMGFQYSVNDFSYSWWSKDLHKSYVGDVGTSTTFTQSDIAFSLTGITSFSWLSSGGIPYGSVFGIMTNDATNFFWDATNKRLGIGTNAPSQKLDVKNGDILIEGDTPILYFDNTNNYIGRNTATGLMTWKVGTVDRLSIGNTGSVTWNPSGVDADFIVEGDNNASLFYVDAGNDRVGIRTSTPTQPFDIVGNFNQTGGNSTINNIYGEAFYTNRTATTLNYAVDGTFYVMFLTNGTNGELNGFKFQGGFLQDSNLTAQVAGVYKVSYSTVGSGQNNHYYYASIFVNGVNQLECETLRNRATGGNIVAMGRSCILTLNANDVVDIRVADIGGTGTGDYYSADLNLLRIGN